MSDGLLWHRIQFAFTVTYHYLFPQLTMGLALLIVIFKVLSLRGGGERCNEVARFWTRFFALNFAMGVVTGIPLEFQFGTNWARFSRFAGEVVGQTLAIEGVFAFVLESAFLGLFLFGERRVGQLRHLAVAVALLVGSWLAGVIRYLALGRERAAFLSSCVFLLGVLATAMTGSYPVWLRSTLDQAYVLTSTNTASGSYALRAGLAWLVVGVSLAAAYFVLVFHIFASRSRSTRRGSPNEAK